MISLQSFHDEWIQPELDKRFGDSGIPESFKVWRCLIRLPHDHAPIVEFNNEFGWLLEHSTLLTANEFEIGKPIYLHEIVRLGKILPPSYNNKRVAFMYFFWSGYKYELFVDFLPDQPEFDPNHEQFQFDGTFLREHINAQLFEITVRLAINAKSLLKQIGLWSATSLIPYPLSKIIERIGAGYVDEARTLLIRHCDTEFISKLVETWMPINAFAVRIDIFRECVFAHSHSKFRTSIYSLLPQIEGVITDWLYPIVNPNTSILNWKLMKRIDDFKAEVLKIEDFEFAYREIFQLVIEFLKEGQPLQKFIDWFQEVDESFPARHALAHGKYLEATFSEENSIKLFLLLDTICQFMMFYEVRILGKDLTTP